MGHLYIHIHEVAISIIPHSFNLLCGYIKLEMLQKTTTLNHFALSTKLYVQAAQVVFAALHKI